jgi:hypothetical protein
MEFLRGTLEVIAESDLNVTVERWRGTKGTKHTIAAPALRYALY